MNFLAHLALSGPDPKVMTGNFLGDFVKGRLALKNLDVAIATGIELHRNIDEFTDRHPVVRKSKDRLRPKYRHFSGVIVDMFYDHLLGAGWNTWYEGSLYDFSQTAYRNLSAYVSMMPPEAQRLLPHLVRGNWLVGYASVDGIHRALSGMASRSRYDSKMEQATDDLKLHMKEFKNEFNDFFPELKNFADAWLTERTGSRD